METEKITDTTNIHIGDTMVYTGNPRGTGYSVPEIGAEWEMKTNNDLICVAIEMIERGRGWEKLIKK